MAKTVAAFASRGLSEIVEYRLKRREISNFSLCSLCFLLFKFKSFFHRRTLKARPPMSLVLVAKKAPFRE